MLPSRFIRLESGVTSDNQGNASRPDRSDGSGGTFRSILCGGRSALVRAAAGRDLDGNERTRGLVLSLYSAGLSLPDPSSLFDLWSSSASVWPCSVRSASSYASAEGPVGAQTGRACAESNSVGSDPS